MNNALIPILFLTILNIGCANWPVDDTIDEIPTPLLEPVPGVSYIIRNFHSGKYLNVFGNHSIDGTKVTVYTKDGTTGQTFTLMKTSDGWYTFTPACAPGSRLNINDTSASEGRNVTIYHNTDHPTQGWYLEKVSDGYIIRSADNQTFVLTAVGPADSSNVIISTYSSGNAFQIWIFETK